jgi:hypothetical protein
MTQGLMDYSMLLAIEKSPDQRSNSNIADNTTALRPSIQNDFEILDEQDILF